MRKVIARYAVQFETAGSAYGTMEACKALRLLIARIDPDLIVFLTQIDDEVLEVPELQS